MKPNILYFKVFGSKYFIFNMKDNLNNFDSKSDVDIFLNYYFFDKTYRVHSNITFYLEK